MADTIKTRTVSIRDEITPELIWSKYSVIQQIIFWLVVIAAWHGLQWIGSTYEQFTIPVWRYTARIQSFFYSGDFRGDVLHGIYWGAGVLLLVLLSDYLIAWIKKEPAIDHILRNREILPRTKKQQYIALLVGVNAGIFEEIFFRGGLFVLLSLLTGSPESAIIITAASFALLHAPMQGWYSTAIIFLVGILLNVLLLSSGSYFTPMFCHITINIGNLFFVPAIFQDELDQKEVENGDDTDSTAEV